MKTNFDIFGREINIGDYVTATCSMTYKQLYLYKVTGFTKTGQLRVEGFIRQKIDFPHLYCTKVPTELAEKHIATYKEYHDEMNKLDSHNVNYRHIEFDEWFLNKLNQ